MKKRMLEAVKPQIKLHPISAWLYALLTVILVILILDVGMLIGNWTLYPMMMSLPSEIIQWLMFTIDPIFMHLLLFAIPSALVMIWVKLAEKRSPVTLGFYKEGAFLELLKGWGIGALLMGSVVGIQVLTGSIHLQGLNFSAANWISFLLIIPFWLIQSGTEELLTRGWLFPVVSKNTRLWVGVAVSSLLFALLHAANPSVSAIPLVNIALFGLLACLYVLKTDNIWGISAMHAAWNCFQGNFFGLNVSGMQPAYAFMQFQNGDVPDYLSGGGFGPEGSIFSSLVMGIYILYLAWSLYKEKKMKHEK
ncbi:CPBP family intramembrane glutamic endopeptidase [Streptococcus cameli]